MKHPPTLRAAALLVVFAGYSFYNLISFLQARRSIRDLFEDLRDGHNLISLLEVLTGEQLVSYVCSHEDQTNYYYVNKSIDVCWIKFCNYHYLILIASHVAYPITSSVFVSFFTAERERPDAFPYAAQHRHGATFPTL